jgi:hypothetical protein
MSNYWIPKYIFRLVDYNSNWTVPPANLPKYLYIEIYDKNKDCEDDYITKYFISIKNIYIIREGKTILIGSNKSKEINLTHYEMNQADANYLILKQLLNLPN